MTDKFTSSTAVNEPSAAADIGGDVPQEKVVVKENPQVTDVDNKPTANDVPYKWAIAGVVIATALGFGYWRMFR